MHTLTLARIEPLPKNSKPTIRANLRTDIPIIVAIVGGLRGAEVEVE